LQDIPSTSAAPPKSPKLSRHKKQRSLLFSLISYVSSCSSFLL
jgi:hypothetical protein